MSRPRLLCYSGPAGLWRYPFGCSEAARPEVQFNHYLEKNRHAMGSAVGTPSPEEIDGYRAVKKVPCFYSDALFLSLSSTHWLEVSEGPRRYFSLSSCRYHG